MPGWRRTDGTLTDELELALRDLYQRRRARQPDTEQVAAELLEIDDDDLAQYEPTPARVARVARMVNEGLLPGPVAASALPGLTIDDRRWNVVSRLQDLIDPVEGKMLTWRMTIEDGLGARLPLPPPAQEFITDVDDAGDFPSDRTLRALAHLLHEGWTISRAVIDVEPCDQREYEDGAPEIRHAKFHLTR